MRAGPPFQVGAASEAGAAAFPTALGAALAGWPHRTPQA